MLYNAHTIALLELEGTIATTMVNVRMDEDVKRDMEAACKELGMNMTTAFTIFAKKVGRERRIPFEVSVDPFYSESNIAHIKRGIEAINKGRGVERELLETERHLM